MNDIGTAGNAVHGRRRIWVPLAVVGLLLMMTAVEAVFARSQPAGEQLVSGTVIEFGSDRQASIQVGDGWVLDIGASDLNSQLVLVRGDMTVELSSEAFPGNTSPAEMWAGMDRLLNIARHAGVEVRLASPTEGGTSSGSGELEGSLQVEPGRQGLRHPGRRRRAGRGGEGPRAAPCR